MAGVVADGPAATLAEAQQPVPPCAPFFVIGLRGSGQAMDGPFGMGRTVGAYVREASGQLPADATQYYSLPYPASPIGPDYPSSEEAGRLGLLVLVRDRIATCPGIRMGIVGYSQGAQAANEVLGLLEPGERNAIRSVLLLADPLSAGATAYDIAVTIQGDPGSHTGGGIFGRSEVPGDIQGRTIDFCISADPVCDTTEDRSTASQALASPVHGAYAECCGGFFPSILGGAFADRLRTA